MSTIAACPRCSQQVSIPIDVAPTATVRCPHCQVEYHLQEALSRIPPLLILVDAGPSAKSDSGIFGMPGLAEPDHSLPPAAPLMGLGAVEDVPPESETQFSPHWHPAPPVPPAAGESDFVRFEDADDEMEIEVDDSAVEHAGGDADGLELASDAFESMEGDAQQEASAAEPAAADEAELDFGDDELNFADLTDIAPPSHASHAPDDLSKIDRHEPDLAAQRDPSHLGHAPETSHSHADEGDELDFGDVEIGDVEIGNSETGDSESGDAPDFNPMEEPAAELRFNEPLTGGPNLDETEDLISSNQLSGMAEFRREVSHDDGPEIPLDDEAEFHEVAEDESEHVDEFNVAESDSFEFADAPADDHETAAADDDAEPAPITPANKRKAPKRKPTLLSNVIGYGLSAVIGLGFAFGALKVYQYFTADPNKGKQVAGMPSIANQGTSKQMQLPEFAKGPTDNKTAPAPVVPPAQTPAVPKQESVTANKPESAPDLDKPGLEDPLGETPAPDLGSSGLDPFGEDAPPKATDKPKAEEADDIKSGLGFDKPDPVEEMTEEPAEEMTEEKPDEAFGEEPAKVAAEPDEAEVPKPADPADAKTADNDPFGASEEEKRAKETKPELAEDTKPEPIEDEKPEPAEEKKPEPAKVADNDIFGEEEATPAAPEKAPEPAPAPAETKLGLKTPVSFNAAQLDKDIKDTQQALAALGGAKDVPPKELNSLKSKAYVKFCALAHTMTFVDTAPDASKKAIADLVHAYCDAPGQFDAVGKVAAKWPKLSKRPSPGVLMPGTVQSQTKKDGVFEVQLTLPGDMTVTLINEQDPKLAPGSKVFVLGSIVDDPAANLVGYTGDEPMVVWSGLLIGSADSATK